jgi:arsenate reductase (thioredoxin)
VEKVRNVLFLCTGNSARSIMAEVMLNHFGRGRFKAYSAGSRPGGSVNPLSLETLEDLGLPTADLRSKSWDEFAAPGAPLFDFIITVCDNAANEACPVWPGKPTTAHWGVADPAAAEGSDLHKRGAFRDAAVVLRRRIDLFLSLPLEKLDALSLRTRLREIGEK